MSLKSFRKGLHPYDGKELSKDSSIREIDAADEMVYPVSQHIGEPAKPVVAVGDVVLKGQLIAEQNGFISSPVFSSVSGTVKAIEKREVITGDKVDCIIIENDKLNNAVEGFGVLNENALDNMTAKDVIDTVTNAGIVGLGGAGFPTGVKISPKNAEDVDTVIINGSECEPYLTADYRLMLEKGQEIVKGIKAVLVALPNAKAVIGIEDNKPEAIKAMEEIIADEEKISVCPLKTKYPQGGERQLIFAVTGRKINSKVLPADRGIVVVNTATCYAIYEAIYLNMPLVHKVMTITGEAVNSPCNLDVPLGISNADVLEAAGGVKEDVVKFISGGPMMGMAMSKLQVPVVKTTSAILAFSVDDVAALPQSACIHCGKCASVCPALLIPQMLAKSVKTNAFDRFEKLGGMECIECGCCTFECPAKIPLTQMCKLGKAKVREIYSKK